MINKVFEKLEITEEDTIKTAVAKGVVEGYVGVAISSAIGLGVLALSRTIIKKMNSNKEEVVKDPTKETYNVWK